MMAAGRAAELGANVLLLEKMERPGKKILITGNGRCNLSNSRDIDSFISQFGPNGRFLYSAFNRFFRDDLLTLLRRYGIECKTEPDGKVYPTTNNARDIVRAFERYTADGKVTMQVGVEVTGVSVEDGRVSGVRTPAGQSAGICCHHRRRRLISSTDRLYRRRLPHSCGTRSYHCQITTGSGTTRRHGS